MRGFEKIKAYEKKEILMPARKTAQSAGYDIAAAEDVVLQPGKATLVPTGLKAYMLADEYLSIHIRSSLAIKHNISLANSQAIIDADYYNNRDNEGHILIALFNSGSADFKIFKGDRVAQGIFAKYLQIGVDSPENARAGGIGSTGR